MTQTAPQNPAYTVTHISKDGRKALVNTGTHSVWCDILERDGDTITVDLDGVNLEPFRTTLPGLSIKPSGFADRLEVRV